MGRRQRHFTSTPLVEPTCHVVTPHHAWSRDEAKDIIRGLPRGVVGPDERV
uniref:Uncharacterized protein n=1 Tax=Daucus carota subsp. sativus TaxID=79200 RepID=A0A166FY34_DAUCS